MATHKVLVDRTIGGRHYVVVELDQKKVRRWMIDGEQVEVIDFCKALLDTLKEAPIRRPSAIVVARTPKRIKANRRFERRWC